MAYTVLARKYRSQTFDDVIGQDPIVQTLKNAIKTGRIAHAYLFTGTRGVGKTTMARILAKSLNCLSANEPTATPCCKCDSCTAVNIGEDIDVIEIDGATNNGVEQVRELRQNAVYRPARCRYKIYIIDEVHMLTVPAFNALLKTLEEPPSHVKFIFATTEPNKVIATIQSRCQRFDFANISPKLIAGQLKSILKKEKIKYEEDLVLLLAKMANGSMRDGLSLLDRLLSTGVEPLNVKMLEEYLGQPNSDKVYALIDAIGDHDAAKTLASTEDLINTGLGEVQIVDSLIDCMRDLMVITSAGAASDILVLTEQQKTKAVELAKKFDTAGLVYSITALEKLRWTIKNSDNPRALLEACLVRFALSEHFINIDELLLHLQGNSTPINVKKKELTKPQTAATPASPKSVTQPAQQFFGTTAAGISSIKDNWQAILNSIGAKLGAGTTGLLNYATPIRFYNGILTLQFAASAKVQKKMCESNGRAEQIETLLAELLSTPLRLNLELAEDQPAVNESPPKPPGAASQRKREIVNDPAVKTVLMGLDATITNIEEDLQPPI